MLRDLMGKVDHIREQRSNVGRDMEIPGKNQKEMLDTKSINT